MKYLQKYGRKILRRYWSHLFEKTLNSRYEIETLFEKDGVYNIKIHARYNNSNVMLTKQFIVEDYKEVEDVDEPEDSNEGHEHHH